MADWTPDPTRTQPATDGSGRRREWAFRDVSPGAPKPAEVRQTPKPVTVVAEVAEEVEFQYRTDASTTALDRAKTASAKRFGRSIDSASADLDAGRWSWPAIALCIFLCGGSLWGFYVSVWGSPLSPRQYPQTQPSITPGTPGVGANHSRDLLIEWSRSATWKRLRPDEQERARKAVEADR